MMELMNKAKDVTATIMPKDKFLDWNKFEEERMKMVIGETKTNHIFEVTAEKSNHMYIQEFLGEGNVFYKIVKEDWEERSWKDWDGEEAFTLPEVLVAPGLQDIKWLECFKNWGTICPWEKKLLFKYYCEDPGERIRDKVKQNTKKAKSARKNRTRSV